MYNPKFLIESGGGTGP